MKNLLIAIIIGMSMLLSGCAGVFLVGAGIGAGAFSYIAGNLTRVYEADYHQSIKASIKVVEQLNFKQKEETVDELKTIIEGHLNYDTPVTIEVVFVEPGSTHFPHSSPLSFPISFQLGILSPLTFHSSLLSKTLILPLPTPPPGLSLPLPPLPLSPHLSPHLNISQISLTSRHFAHSHLNR